MSGNVGNRISQKTSDVKIAARQRRNFAMNLRLAGFTFREMVPLMEKWAAEKKITLPSGYDERQICRDIMVELKKLDKINLELAKQLLTLELERCDKLQVALWQDALKGEEKKTDRILKIMERRAKLLGLDAPSQHEIGNKDGEPLRVIVDIPDNERE